MKIYGIDISNNVLKVRFCANALGLEYEYIPTTPMDGGTQTEEYKKINPTGKIPALEDEGQGIFESNTICRYLAQKNNSPLYPLDLMKRTKVDQWLDFTSIHVGTALGRVLFNRWAHQVMGVEKDEQSLQDGLDFLDKFLPILDKQLGENKFIAGDELTIADISLLATLEPAEMVQVDLSKYPNLAKWRKDLQSQDWVKKTYPSYAEMAKEMMAKMQQA